jgi:proteasome accessory factor A
MMDLQYHDIRPNVGIFHRLLKAGHVQRIVPQEAVLHAINNPPMDTRAYFRGTCLKRFPEQIHAASWNSLIFDVGGQTFQKVPMQYPLRGTREMVGDLIQQSPTAGELLDTIEATSGAN